MMVPSNPKQTGRTVHYRPPRKRRQRPRPKMQPPLTPMIDVTFLLLLYFLLTTTFRQAEGQIPSVLPQKRDIVAPAELNIEPIRITLYPVGAHNEDVIYEMIGDTLAISSPAGLHRRLVERQALLGSSDVPVIIAPQWNVRWQYVVEAFNQALRAKFTKIGIAPSE